MVTAAQLFAMVRDLAEGLRRDPAAAAVYCASRLPGGRSASAWHFGSGDLGSEADGDELLRRLTPGSWRAGE